MALDDASYFNNPVDHTASDAYRRRFWDFLVRTLGERIESREDLKSGFSRDVRAMKFLLTGTGDLAQARFMENAESMERARQLLVEYDGRTIPNQVFAELLSIVAKIHGNVIDVDKIP